MKTIYLYSLTLMVCLASTSLYANDAAYEAMIQKIDLALPKLLPDSRINILEKGFREGGAENWYKMLDALHVFIKDMAAKAVLIKVSVDNMKTFENSEKEIQNLSNQIINTTKTIRGKTNKRDEQSSKMIRDLVNTTRQTTDRVIKSLQIKTTDIALTKSIKNTLIHLAKNMNTITERIQEDYSNLSAAHRKTS